jgi:hypothetical protein
MRKSLEELLYKIEAYGGDINEKDIDLRNILRTMLQMIDQALPKEVESN